MPALHPCLLRMVAVVLLGLAAVPVRAADWPIKRGPAREPAPHRFDVNQWKKLPREFLEDVPACTLYFGISHLVEADGTIETITHDITRFNGRKGIERLGEYRNVSYDPSYQSLVLNEARVYKKNGTLVEIEPKHVQLRDLDTEYLVYNHDKQLVISFPSLEVGDAIEVKWTTRGKSPEHLGQFFTRYTFGDDRYPVAIDEMRVRLPRAKSLKHATTGGKLEPDVRDDGDFRTYLWRALNRRELPLDENLPSKEDLRLAVACSTFASWEEVGQWKLRLREECWKCTPEIRQVVQEVTRDLKTPLDKARALTYWVRRHIRYVSVGERHDFTPHAPPLVLSNRYGDCKDQSQLLAVMLREAGLPVALATLGTLDDGQIVESVPSPWGTHAILLVTLDGKEHWIDTTVSQAGWDFLPRDDRDRVCYVVDDKGLRLARTPASTAANNRIEQTTILTIGADGSSRSERTAIYHGSAALAQRSEWVEVPPGERRRALTGDLQNAQSRARLCRLAIDEARLKNFDEPVRAQITFEVPGHFTGDSDREGSLTDSVIWAKLLSHNLDYDREVALDLGEPFETIHRYSVHLPPALRFVDLPKDQQVRSPWGSFQLTLRADPNEPRQLDAELRLHLDKTRVEPGDFLVFRQFHEDVFKHYRVWLSLQPTLDPDDAPALEALLAQAPSDSASAVVLARLYQHEDRTRDARRVVQRARHYCPKELALWELTVALADDRQEEEEAYQKLIRLAPSTLRYPLALGESRVDHGDFEGARKILEPVARQAAAKERGQAYYQLARCCFLQNRPGAALEQLKEAARVDPGTLASTAPLLLKARIQEKLGQPAEASMTYREALTGEADCVEALDALVRLELADNNLAAALPYLRRYAAAVSADVPGLVKAADYYLRLKRNDDAFDLAMRARDLDFHPGTQRILGLVNLQRGNFRQAVFHLDRASLDSQVLEGLIQGYLALGDLNEAELQGERIEEVPGGASASLRRSYALTLALSQRRVEVRKGLPVAPGQAEIWAKAIDHFVCAEHAHANGRSAEQVDSLLAGAFVEGVTLGPAHALRGLRALEKGRLSKALADAEQALALAPREARGFYVRGRVRLERGTEGALADLSRAADLNQRKDPAMLHWLAAALFRAGARAEALRTQRDAVALQPDDEELKEQLRELEKAER